MSDLEGILVIALEQAVAAPYVSGRLAEAGARVIKIEREEGDFARHYDSLVKDQSAYFVWLNAGKESITLDLKHSEDAALLNRMLEKADVFIQNLAPGAIERLGFDPKALIQDHPGLIVCSVTGYGNEGPFKKQKAYDLLIQAESGLCSITGIGDQLTRVGVSVSDISAGMTAYQEILRALFARERDPEHKGRILEVSLFHSTADWMNVPYLQHAYGDFTPQNHGLKHPSIAPYGNFTCSDGKDVLISIQNEREWHRLCDIALEQPELTADVRYNSNETRLGNRTALEAQINTIFARYTQDEMIERLQRADIAFGRVNSLEDLAQHPQNRYRNIQTANGLIQALGRGAKIEGKVDVPQKVPELGADNERIREEFGK
ncbi:MAG: CaiB/BaiF CoA-transferase family protein [Pseudomonadota bacterium]